MRIELVCEECHREIYSKPFNEGWDDLWTSQLVSKVTLASDLSLRHKDRFQAKCVSYISITVQPPNFKITIKTAWDWRVRQSLRIEPQHIQFIVKVYAGQEWEIKDVRW